MVHIMQPSFRQYYHLEELWGEKPVRLKLGAAKPEAPAAKKAVLAEKPPATLKRSNAAKKGVAEAFPSKAQIKKNEAVQAAAVRKTTARSAAVKAAAAKPVAAKPVAASKVATKSVAKPAAKTVVVKAPAKKVAAKNSSSRTA